MVNRCAVLVGIVALAALVVAAAAPAAGPEQIAISFDLSSATCSQLPPGTVIHGEGTAQFSIGPAGNLHSVINGTATDGAGGFWRFNYAQNARPLGGGGPVEVTDHFSLVGSGSPIKLHSHFVADFTSSDLESADLLALKQIHGDPIGCDPI
jgi:hypothetical protein